MSNLVWTFANFDAEEDHELSLKIGQVMLVEQSTESGWLKGKVVGVAVSETSPISPESEGGDGFVGWFPSTFVRPWKPSQDAGSTAKTYPFENGYLHHQANT